MPLPPVPADRDADHLRLLAIFHFVYAGLGVLGLVFLGLHYTFMQMFFQNPAMMEQMRHPSHGQPFPFDPQNFFDAIFWLYVFLGVWMAAVIVLNLAAGVNLNTRKARTFILVVAALNCLSIPFGTVLGIFTIVVLTRETVRPRFESGGPPMGL